jgi:hypothetical protein
VKLVAAQFAISGNLLGIQQIGHGQMVLKVSLAQLA